jgi:hypothetical protein
VDCQLYPGHVWHHDVANEEIGGGFGTCRNRLRWMIEGGRMKAGFVQDHGERLSDYCLIIYNEHNTIRAWHSFSP